MKKKYIKPAAGVIPMDSLPPLASNVSHQAGWAIDNTDANPDNVNPVEKDTTTGDNFLDLD